MRIQIIICSALLLGCSSENPEITGIWRIDGTERSFEFGEDGSFSSRSLGGRAEGTTWRVEIDRLILAGVDTFTITELTTNRLELVGGSVQYSLSRFDDTETLTLKLREAEQRVRNLKRATKLYSSQIRHLQAGRDSLQRALERTRAELDSLHRESEP
jgi:hypothetical protein